jgi:hydrogenase maturation factor
MRLHAGQFFVSPDASRSRFQSISACGVAMLCSLALARGEDTKAEPAWRPLPLIADGKVADGWCHVGWGGFAVDDGALRTECDPKGLGLLVYEKERFGNCQLRVVFRSKDAKSNAGVFVRIADGILEQVRHPGATFDRDAGGRISQASMKRMMESAEREEGPWFAVHRGYEVQIMDENDELHRTGAIYSLAASSAISGKPPGEWKTMIITLVDNRILVDLEGQRVTGFDPASPNVPRERKWFEPKREPKRREVGYLGLQNHDPDDVVWFKEISVRPLPDSRAK